ncbi:MAG: DegT/DnrJ/EryC1/StrS family aminotransferase [Oscillospiraceae bacterium]|jgi:arginine/lysine/ornithine decarboxylase|nr:DegT/DnrJ/EryC1/StrS family aminotransferase [Oscillospiraceae bacterium]
MNTLAKFIACNSRYPLHMPGHKRDTALAGFPKLAEDITEVLGADDLSAPGGFLLDLERLGAELYHSRHALISVNGSSACNLAAIRAAFLKFGGSELLITEDAHRSVWNAAELCGLKPVFERSDKTKIAVVTTPMYDGTLRDISGTDGLCVIVDAAHGAHLGFDAYFPASPIASGADLVVMSLHKTLPALGQTALLHICSDRFSIVEKIRGQMNVFQTSSPSYLLLASIERCLTLLRDKSGELFSDYADRLRKFYEAAGEKVLQPYQAGKLTRDPGKIFVPGVTAEKFRKNGFEPEREFPNGTLLMTSIADPDWVFEKLLNSCIQS